MGEDKVIIDSNVFVAVFLMEDSLHSRATQLVSQLKKQGAVFYTINLVLQESATVLSMRKGMASARTFYAAVHDFVDQVAPFDESVEKESWKVFLSQTKKGTSFVDCAILATARHYNIDKIVSFDRFYPKELLLPVIQ
ncbi:MAG: type II toxin-antitoxin system VapC family toxin [Candidatus Gottesmanbacteria bacterium]|nr:type II toxin-antitoxin system VapC family toxin [Candidatus Gottesmanbacteria bacterium]